MSEFKNINRATESYTTHFTNKLRQKAYDGLMLGESGAGLCQLPAKEKSTYDTEIRTYNAFRGLATELSATVNDRSIKAVDVDTIANWITENDPTYDESTDDFTTLTVNNHKLGTIIKISKDFVYDAGFDIGDYVAKSFAKRIGMAEEAAFVNGTGENMPTGILHATAGAEVGVTAAAKTAVTFDEVIGLFFAVKPVYRKNAVWMVNDNTALALRTLKSGNGTYLWNEANDTILGKKVIICNSMPDMAAGSKSIAFGDFSYYWIIQRQPMMVRTLLEKYAMARQIGYLGNEYLDAKLIRSDAVKVLKMKAE